MTPYWKTVCYRCVRHWLAQAREELAIGDYLGALRSLCEADECRTQARHARDMAKIPPGPLEHEFWFKRT